MQLSRIPLFIYGWALVFSLLIPGCVSSTQRTNRIHPQFNPYDRNMKNFALPSPDIKIYKLTAGGIRELIDEWSSEGKRNVVAALKKNFETNALTLTILETDAGLEAEMEDMLQLYRVVQASISLHAFNPQSPHAFPEKIRNFDYSVGPIDSLLDKYQADALVLVTAHNEVSTGGRKTLMFLGVLTGVLTGIYAGPGEGTTIMSMALIDRSGTVLWYDQKSGSGINLAEPAGAENLVNLLFQNFNLYGK